MTMEELTLEPKAEIEDKQITNSPVELPSGLVSDSMRREINRLIKSGDINGIQEMMNKENDRVVREMGEMFSFAVDISYSSIPNKEEMFIEALDINRAICRDKLIPLIRLYSASLRLAIERMEKQAITATFPVQQRYYRRRLNELRENLVKSLGNF